MKAFLAALLVALGFSTSLLAEGSWVYLSGNLSQIHQRNSPLVYQTSTEKNYFLFDQSDGFLLRFRTYTLNGVKRYENLGAVTLRGDLLPSSRTLRGSVFNYHLITATDPTRTVTHLKGTPNAATGAAIGSEYGAFPSSLAFARQIYILNGSVVQRTEEKGTLSVLRPMSKEANAGPDSFELARQRLINFLVNSGFSP